MRPIHQFFFAASTGLSLSASGTSGIVSVSLSGGLFSGTATVTLAVSAGTPTITVTGSSVNNGNGTWTVTPSAGQTGFTYTNSATATITYTNAQGWSNPSPTSYVVGGGILFRRRPGSSRSGTRTALYN